jgi:Ran GTPase-activating protein (RanGAP) involved in mRNA processing and transport
MKVGNYGIELLMEGISQLKKLKTLKLNLAKNDISEEGMLYVRESFSKLNSLEELDIQL